MGLEAGQGCSRQREQSEQRAGGVKAKVGSGDSHQGCSAGWAGQLPLPFSSHPLPFSSHHLPSPPCWLPWEAGQSPCSSRAGQCEEPVGDQEVKGE